MSEKAFVAGGEIEFFLVSRSIGDMRFTINGEDIPVGDDSERVKPDIMREFIKADEDNGGDFTSKLTEGLYSGIMMSFGGILEELRELSFTEVGIFKEFRREDNLSAIFSGL